MVNASVDGPLEGICTLGNDRVADQIIALLNSIETMMGPEMPVCIYPYDDQVSKLADVISTRPQVALYDNQASINKWDTYVKALWDTHPTARQTWQSVGSNGYHRLGTHRRYCAFDGPFDRFIYMDADTVLMSPVHSIFKRLDTEDFITYDFQHKDPTHVYTVTNPRLHQVFAPERIKNEIFCSGFYATKRSILTPDQQDWLLLQLKSGDAEILYPMAPDQTLLNYFVMKLSLKYCNLALQLPPDQVTGNSVTSTHFEAHDHIVYDRAKRLTYLHYIGISSQRFKHLCQGENLAIPYRDVFLHYRYLHEPECQPTYFGIPEPPMSPYPTMTQKILRKIGLSR